MKKGRGPRFDVRRFRARIRLNLEPRTSNAELERSDMTRIAAVADLHCPRTSGEVLKPFFTELAAQADIILLCGDLTDYGKPEEAQALAQSLSGVGRIPIVAVLGNHDYECGQAEEVER